MTLPKAELETFILLPFEIAATDGNDVDREALQAYLAGQGWQKVDHGPDRLSAQPQHPLPDQCVRYQAYHYFHPFIRAFWYAPSLVTRYRRGDVHFIEVRPSRWLDQPAIRFQVVCDLLHFAPSLGVLSLHLRSDVALPLPQLQACLNELRRRHPPYLGWARPESPGGLGPPTLSYAGHFPAEVRLLDVSGNVLPDADYSAVELMPMLRQFLASNPGAGADGGPEALQPQVWSRHWAALLRPFGTCSSVGAGYSAIPLADDRAALASLVSVVATDDGPLTDAIDRGNLIRLCFADAPGNDRLPYSERFLGDFERDYCYDRFWYLDDESGDAPSRIMNCGYAFTWLGYRGDRYFFANETDGAPVIFRHAYVPMAVMAHLQKAALLVFSRRLAELTPFGEQGRPKALDADAFARLQSDFMAFVQTYWFDEVSPQQQGIELFRMWQRHLNLPGLYASTREKLQDLGEFIETSEARKQSEEAIVLNRLAGRVGWLSLLLSSLALMMSILGINTFAIDTPSWFMWRWMVSASNLVAWALFVLAGIFALAIVLLKLPKLLQAKKRGAP